jgi:deoxyribodipyrimidine photo-lyase
MDVAGADAVTGTRVDPVSVAIVLFTRDLRVHDHAALHVAARNARHVVPLFVLDEDLLSRSGRPNRLSFLLDALTDLRRSLRERGADLVLRRGDAVAETVRLARETRAEVVYVGGDASAYARRRERRLEEACAREQVAVRVEQTIAVVPPGALAPQGRDHYRVFTPYWRRWRDEPAAQAVPPPKALALPPGVSPGRLPRLGELVAGRRSPSLPPGGEQEGRQRLEHWLKEGLADYERARDLLAADRTSRLSPYLHYGCISATEALSRARAHGDVADGFVRQLCWRDFFLQLLAANPRLPDEDLRPRGTDWNDDGEALARWSAGQTGYPIVDAAMRQLYAEGWIHNRGRLIVGSFLTRTLGIDWREGARVFSDLLVDADVANNVGNWQWVAGTGANQRPNRILSPLAQARRFDPDGAYVHRYVPELDGPQGRAVHEPWRQRTPPRGYPPPIVDPGQAVGPPNG